MKKSRIKNKAELKVFNPFDIMKCMDERPNRPMMRCDLKVDHQIETDHQTKIESGYEITK